jgi:hypothetical protein
VCHYHVSTAAKRFVSQETLRASNAKLNSHEQRLALVEELCHDFAEARPQNRFVLIHESKLEHTSCILAGLSSSQVLGADAAPAASITRKSQSNHASELHTITEAYSESTLSSSLDSSKIARPQAEGRGAPVGRDASTVQSDVEGSKPAHKSNGTSGEKRTAMIAADEASSGAPDDDGYGSDDFEDENARSSDAQCTSLAQATLAGSSADGLHSMRGRIDEQQDVANEEAGFGQALNDLRQMLEEPGVQTDAEREAAQPWLGASGEAAAVSKSAEQAGDEPATADEAGQQQAMEASEQAAEVEAAGSGAAEAAVDGEPAAASEAAAVASTEVSEGTGVRGGLYAPAWLERADAHDDRRFVRGVG